LGDLTDNIYYWADYARLYGEEESRKIKAWGVDAGFYYTNHSSPLNPSFTLSYAAGSGDNGLGDNTNFSQTGLHSNEYYGQVLDPELSNLQIATAGMGFQPDEEFSVEQFYHSYWQINPSALIIGDGVEIVADGINHRVGQALDLSMTIGDASEYSLSLA